MGIRALLHYTLILSLFLVTPTGQANDSGDQAKTQKTTARKKTSKAKPFDEVTGGKKGKTRPAYEGVIDVFKKLSPQQRNSIRRRSLRDFSGDNELFPLPRVLTDKEFAEIREGVQQRADAILAFLVDHYSGKKQYLKDGVIPYPVIERITTRSGEKAWEGLINPNTIRFWYGPDLIRGPPTPKFKEGRFYVVEDNPGFLGGVGDLIRAKESLYRNIPEYKEIFDSPDPRRFYEQLAEEYKRRAAAYGGIPVVLMYTKSLASDNEEQRIHRIFEQLGIEVVRFNPYYPNSNFKSKIVVRNGLAYLEKRRDNGKVLRKRIGYVVANMDPVDLEPSHRANRRLRVIEEAESQLEDKRLKAKHRQEIERLLAGDALTGKIHVEKLARYINRHSNIESWLNREAGIRGFLDVFLTGKVGLTNGPGTEFIGDKEFYIYVDKLIRYYLGQEPILQNIRTQSFAKYNKKGKPVLDRSLLRRVYENIKQFVIKGVAGRGGDQVWVGPKIDSQQITDSRQRIVKTPSTFIVQDFTALSTLEGQIGDIRLHSEVSVKERAIVADVPWARVVSAKGDGKVNISSNGAEATVLVRDLAPRRCSAAILRVLGL